MPKTPRVADLASEGYPLIGGRLDVGGAAPVPTLVYGSAKHLISVVEIQRPGRADAPPDQVFIDAFRAAQAD